MCSPGITPPQPQAKKAEKDHYDMKRKRTKVMDGALIRNENSMLVSDLS